MDQLGYQNIRMSYSKVSSVNELLMNDYPLWTGQRIINHAWVEELKNNQLEFIKKFNCILFPGSFIIITWRGIQYLVDGQHRYETLKELNRMRIDMSNASVVVEHYDCGTNEELARSIYVMANARYYNNGTIDRAGNPYEQTGGNLVAMAIQKLYESQIRPNSTRAPYFDINDLLREINESRILCNLSADQVIKLIQDENTKFGACLKNYDKGKYNNCSAKFYLVYHSPKCRWFKQLKGE